MVAGVATVDSITNPDQMFADAGINLIIARATHADGEKKKVTLSDGREIPYDKLLLGTGASPMVPPIEGCDLEGVFSLRSAPDALNIRNFLEEENRRKLVLIGAGFTYLEVATLLASTKPDHYDVTVIELLAHPLSLMLDAEMAVQIQEYLVEKGFKMKMAQKVVRILGQNGKVAGVEVATPQHDERHPPRPVPGGVRGDGYAPSRDRGTATTG